MQMKMRFSDRKRSWGSSKCNDRPFTGWVLLFPSWKWRTSSFECCKLLVLLFKHRHELDIWLKTYLLLTENSLHRNSSSHFHTIRIPQNQYHGCPKMTQMGFHFLHNMHLLYGLAHPAVLAVLNGKMIFFLILARCYSTIFWKQKNLPLVSHDDIFSQPQHRNTV